MNVSPAADTLDSPDEPIASINGEPVFLGELNLILADRLGTEKLKNATIEIRQAAAAILIRRHLALRSLRSHAGDALESMIKKEIDQFKTELERRGSSLAKFAEERFADEQSLLSDLSWQAAWRQYLKSRMTHQNLRKYFQQQHVRYDGSRWHVSQIFFPLPDRDSTSIKATSDRMTTLADQLRTAGSVDESFAAAAREHSEAGSAANDGKIGWVQNEGDLPRSVMQAVRAAEVGQVTGPIQSPLGIHLLLVHDYQAGQITFEEMTDQSQLRRDAADMLFESLVRQQKDSKVVWQMEELRPPILLP